MSKKGTLNIPALEKKALRELSKIAYDIDSPDLGRMYDAVGRLASHQNSRSLLPKAMDLLDHPDQNVKQSAFTVAGKFTFGEYTGEVFNSLKSMNPVEREQVLQGIQEKFNQIGGPESTSELKRWIEALEGLGKEHQPTVFGLMRYLGGPGKRWVTKQIKDNFKNISLGAVPALSGFPGKTKKSLIKLITETASKNRRDMLPFICGIVDQTTYSNLSVFLKESKWQERAEIASAVSASGIKSTSGFVMELVGDPNWQVKQALLKKLNTRISKFSSLLKILSFLVKESNDRVRTQAERTLLLLGSEKCLDTTVREQRRKLENQYRPQLLRAAGANKDLEAVWLGVDLKTIDPMHDITKKVTEEENNAPIVKGEEKSVLMAALLGAQKQSTAESEETQAIHADDLPLDPTIPASSKFLLLLQRMTDKVGKDVPLNDILTKAEEAGITEDEFEEIIVEFEKQGIIYRSSKGTVSYVDIEL
ncbi:MAG: hypothetical protein E3J86_05995 [Candidatus Thorarchaeota archaeon]|nr:MAG: hypothetical protein E3J86_05995 [Candidatus Thorarchaeota archaeon]